MLITVSQTDNGPPFNSEGFTKFSADRGIQHVKTHPYHPQGNPVENFMRPIGKCMKAAHHSKANKKQALNDMLSSYRATPHPSTGIAPGNIMFRSGFKKDFPRTSSTDEEIIAALQSDRDSRQLRGSTINASNHRTLSHIQPNQLVYVRNMERRKFDPLFGPELHKVISLTGNGGTLLRLSDNKIVRRHLDDIKDASCVVEQEEEDMCWMNDNSVPIPPNRPPHDLAPLPPALPVVVQQPNPRGGMVATAAERPPKNSPTTNAIHRW